MNELQRITQQIADVRERFNRNAAELRTLAELPDTRFGDGERTRWDDISRATDKLRTELEALEAKRDDLLTVDTSRSARAGTLAGARAATGDGAAAAGEYRTAYRAGGYVGDHFERSDINVEDQEAGGTFRDRALAAIEGWDRSIPAEWRESAERLIEKAPTSRNARRIADNIIEHSNPLYLRAFDKFLQHGPDGMHLMDRDEAAYFVQVQQRAVNEGSVSAGQAVVPSPLDPTILLTNVGSNNPYRSISTVKTISSQTWKGITSQGISAEWTAEAAEATDASPTFTQPTITPVRADAYVQASFEVIEDSSLASDLATLFMDARDRLEATAFAVGTGSTQPFGVVSVLSGTTASRLASTTNGSIGYVDLLAIDGQLPARYRNQNTAWTMHHGIANVVRSLSLPSSVNFSPWVDFGGALPPKLLGYDVHEASGMQGTLSSATSSNDDVIVIGDFSQGYFIVDRTPAAVAFVPIVIGSNRRPTGEAGWFYHWRTGANVVNADAFRLLRV